MTSYNAVYLYYRKIHLSTHILFYYDHACHVHNYCNNNS